MKKIILFFLLVIAFATCTEKKSDQPQMKIPAGMAIRSQFTTRLDYENKPSNDITYIPFNLPEITVYTTFDGITQEPHSYQWVVVNSAGQHACPQEGVYQWTPGGTSENVWTRIQISNCFATPGDYTIRIYLDGNWVLAKNLKVLSQEEMNSGQFEAYWNKDKYPEFYPPAKTKLKGDWIVQTIANDPRTILQLMVVPFQGHNRILAVMEDAGVYTLQELTNYYFQEILRYENGENDQPRRTRFQVVDTKLYLFNSKFQHAVDLSSGQVLTNIKLPFKMASESGFLSPKGDHTVSRSGVLDGKALIDATSCPGTEIITVSWSDDGTKFYYQLYCQQGLQSGIYRYDFATSSSQRVLEDFELASLPAAFNNNGSEFIAFVEDEENQNAKVKIATQLQYYSEAGFGDNYYWNGSISFPFEESAIDAAPLQVNFLPSPEMYLSYDYGDDYGMGSRYGAIYKIGSIKGGALDGKELYRIRDNESWEDKGGPQRVYYTIESQFMVRNGNELVMFNVPVAERDSYQFPDLDGKRKKSDLFKGVTKVVHHKNQLIARLTAPSLLSIPNAKVLLQREGVVNDPGSKSNYRKLFDHETEGEIYVKQEDDGSFWRFNGDQTATLFSYSFDFGVTLNGEAVALEEYVPFTNRDCQGNQIDFAHIITPDPSRLKPAGETSNLDPVFTFNSDNDDILKKEYDILNEAYGEYETPFKSFREFVATNPLFLWKDPFGRYVRYIRKENLSPTNCEPILYLYPETTTDVVVQLGAKVNVIAARPSMHEGWHVRAEQNGSLIDLTTSKKYDRLFWEGISGYLPPAQKGFVVETLQLSDFFDQQLTDMGLTTKETADFKAAWLKEMQEAPYYFVGFYEQHVIDKYAPMTITPKPETIIRILMDYRPLNAPIVVEHPLPRTKPQRNGFTAIEWGGLKR